MPEVNWDEVPDSATYVDEAGWWPVRVIQVTPKDIGTPREKWELVLEVREGQRQGETFRDWLSWSPKALKRIKLVFAKLGVALAGKTAPRPSDVQGREGWACLGWEQNQAREYKLKVPFGGWRSVSEGPGGPVSKLPPVAAPAGQDVIGGGGAAISDSDVPF